MINLLIIIAVVWNFYIGYTRGIILQAFYSVSLIVSGIIAGMYYQKIAKLITLWVPYSNPVEGAKVNFFTSVDIFQLGKVYYKGVAFVAIFVAVYLICRLIGIFLHFAPISYFENWVTNTISGGLASLTTLVFSSLGLSVLATIPMDVIQNHLAASSFAKLLINHFPILTAVLQKLWVG
ncbi:CvpA family protein [Streptococcus caprae]|uniref:CvpA family protein n=1 Tax=Streptococcus caprae TaxID=1640501 RepID=A0ABV8CT60_9STRE